MFNIDLGDFYHSYLELKARKMNRTKFLDSLRDALIKRMDEQDEKHSENGFLVRKNAYFEQIVRDNFGTE